MDGLNINYELMDIDVPQGTKVRYIGFHLTGEYSEWIMSFDGNDDPRGKLKDGEIYTVDHTEVHSWHTKVFLQEVEGIFGSCHFAKVD